MSFNFTLNDDSSGTYQGTLTADQVRYLKHKHVSLDEAVFDGAEEFLVGQIRQEMFKEATEALKKAFKDGKSNLPVLLPENADAVCKWYMESEYYPGNAAERKQQKQSLEQEKEDLENTE